MPRPNLGTYRTLMEYKQWNGIDNVTKDDLRLRPGFVRAANNVDIDDSGMLHSRVGILQSILSGNCHSLWSDGKSLGFFVKDNNLYQIDSIYRSGSTWYISYTSVLTDLGESKLQYIPVGDKIFFSNLYKSGYIEDSEAHSFPEPDHSKLENTFKTRMVGGYPIEYFNSRLYVVQDEIIFFSDAANPMITDTRKNFMIPGGAVKMMVGVKDGMYISHGNKITFLRYLGESKFGDTTLATPDFDFIPMLDVSVVPGSSIVLERIMLGGKAGIGSRDAFGRAAVFATEIGIFMGLPGGHLYDCTSSHYAVSDIEDGTAMIRWNNGYHQYIFLGERPAEIGVGSGVFSIPRITFSGTGASA